MSRCEAEMNTNADGSVRHARACTFDATATGSVATGER